MKIRTAARAAGLASALAGTAELALPLTASPDTHPAHYSAPYLQLADDTVGDIAAYRSATGTKFFPLAFLIPSSACTQLWEASGKTVGAYKSQIQSLKNARGDVSVSFGGAEGGEAAIKCTNVKDLQAAYAKVVSTYGITHLDFDIE